MTVCSLVFHFAFMTFKRLMFDAIQSVLPAYTKRYIFHLNRGNRILFGLVEVVYMCNLKILKSNIVFNLFIECYNFNKTR